MTTATLCQLCQSIPLRDLAPFPDSSYTFTLGRHKHLAALWHRGGDDPIPESLGFHHHRSLASLHASAAGCDLCREIQVQADALLADVAKQEAEYEALLAGRPGSQGPPADPSFNLWVTARGEGGEGFWVVSRSVSYPEGILFPIATFGLCAEDDSPLAETLPGRPIIGPPSHRMLDRVALWVDECNSHENSDSDDPVLPTRVLDVAGPGSPTIVKVVEPEEGTRAAYTALSYCWGSVSNPYTTTRALLNERKKGINASELPRTHRDAIEVTRRLGVRYMWIDCLCICQDDAKDWERESARMAGVYSNAYLTIAASGSADSSGGLFFDRPERTYLRVPLKPTGHEMLVFPLDKDREVVRDYRINMKDQPLGTRAWAFQERILARRVLHFASDQVSFECPEGTIFEDGLRMPYRYLYVYDQGESQAWSRRRLRDSGAPIHRWYSILRKYGDRELTFPDDKLPALSGVAKVYASLLDDEYVAGLWRKRLIEGLCWDSMGCKAVEKCRAPSWSPASVDGEVAAGFETGYREVGSVVDCHVEIDGDNPFGRVKDGWLKIEAPLVPLELAEETLARNICIKTEGGSAEGSVCWFDTMDRRFSVSGEVVRGMKLYALVLAVLAYPEEADRDPVYKCLVVRESGRSGVVPGAMERVGSIPYGPDDFGAGELEATTTITLV